MGTIAEQWQVHDETDHDQEGGGGPGGATGDEESGAAQSQSD